MAKTLDYETPPAAEFGPSRSVDTQAMARTIPRRRKKAADFTMKRIKFIAEKFGCQPMQLLPADHRPQTISGSFLYHLAPIATRCNTAEIVTRILQAAVDQRLRNFTISSCRHNWVVQDDLVAVRTAIDHYVCCSNVEVVGEEFKVPIPIDKYLHELPQTVATSSELRKARIKKMLKIAPIQMQSTKFNRAKHTKFVRGKDSEDPALTLSNYANFHGRLYFGGVDTGKVWGITQLTEIADYLGNWDFLTGYVEGAGAMMNI